MNRTIATRRGFSLLELLAVMSIMALLTTMAVTSYFSAIHGMARRGALKQLVNTLTLARQRACMDSARYSVVFFNEITGTSDTDVTPSYVMSKEIGRITFLNGSFLIDEFAPLDRIFGVGQDTSSYLGNLRLYDLTRGGWSQVYPWALAYNGYQATSASTGKLYNLNTYALKKNSPSRNEPDWQVGDAYGVEAAPIRFLPKGFQFSELRDNPNQAITLTFFPDGRAKWSTGNKIGLLETRPPKQSVDINVNSSDGLITYSETWN